VTKLDDLLPPADIAAAVEAGHLRHQTHPTQPLAILNYTDKAMWDRAWTTVTRTCRGLIYNTDTGDIVARPWVKFHNYGEPGAPQFDLSARAVVTDKMDGSLAICHPLPSGGYAIATRGSFTSEQAKHGTRLLHTTYEGWVPPDGVTVLFEVVFRGNRIVLDYGDLDALVFLGAVDTATGASRTRFRCRTSPSRRPARLCPTFRRSARQQPSWWT
jgi:RNA ligase